MPKVAHPFAKDIHLRLRAQLSAVFRCAGRLSFQREFDASFLKHGIRSFQKWKHTPDPEICHRLINDLLDFHRRHAEVQRSVHELLIFIHALAADQCGKDRHPAGLVIQPLSLLIDDLIKGKIVKTLNELGIGTEEIRLIAGKHLFVICCCEL